MKKRYEDGHVIIEDEDLIVDADAKLREEFGEHGLVVSVYEDDIDSVLCMPICPMCDREVQCHDGVEQCLVHGPVITED